MTICCKRDERAHRARVGHGALLAAVLALCVLGACLVMPVEATDDVTNDHDTSHNDQEISWQGVYDSSDGTYDEQSDDVKISDNSLNLPDSGTYYYYLSSDTVKADITVGDGVTLYLCLNGNVLEGNGNYASVITVESGGALILVDCNSGETHNYHVDESGLYVLCDTTCGHDTSDTNTISGGIVTGGSSSTGGGVYVNGGTFKMYGGNIVGNEAGNGWGGGVYINGTSNATFIMPEDSTGAIVGNTAHVGGGVAVHGQNAGFTMYDGIISDNTASNGEESHSGGVYVYNGTFTMYDGIISDNTAYWYGGGVSVVGGTFKMYGGSISENIVQYETDNDYGFGGGVYVNNEATLEMYNGTISGNTTTYYGGGVYITNSTFNMSGGIISNNTAIAGSEMYVAGATFTMSGGTLGNDSESTLYSTGTIHYKGGSLIVNDIEGYASNGVNRGQIYFYHTTVNGSTLSIGTMSSQDIHVEIRFTSVEVTPDEAVYGNVNQTVTATMSLPSYSNWDWSEYISFSNTVGMTVTTTPTDGTSTGYQYSGSAGFSTTSTTVTWTTTGYNPSLDAGGYTIGVALPSESVGTALNGSDTRIGDSYLFSDETESSLTDVFTVNPAQLMGTITISPSTGITVGVTLTASFESTNTTSPSYEYAWYRWNGSSYTKIYADAGESNKYTLTADDYGCKIVAVAYATDNNHTGYVYTVAGATENVGSGGEKFDPSEDPPSYPAPPGDYGTEVGNGTLSVVVSGKTGLVYTGDGLELLTAGNNPVTDAVTGNTVAYTVSIVVKDSGGNTVGTFEKWADAEATDAGTYSVEIAVTAQGYEKYTSKISVKIDPAELKGSVSITNQTRSDGTLQVHDKLEASYDDTSDEGTLTIGYVWYKWSGSGGYEYIVENTDGTYEVTAEDIGYVIVVVAYATDDNHTGHVAAAYGDADWKDTGGGEFDPEKDYNPTQKPSGGTTADGTKVNLVPGAVYVHTLSTYNGYTITNAAFSENSDSIFVNHSDGSETSIGVKVEVQDSEYVLTVTVGKDVADAHYDLVLTITTSEGQADHRICLEIYGEALTVEYHDIANIIYGGEVTFSVSAFRGTHETVEIHGIEWEVEGDWDVDEVPKWMDEDTITLSYKGVPDATGTHNITLTATATGEGTSGTGGTGDTVVIGDILAGSWTITQTATAVESFVVYAVIVNGVDQEIHANGGEVSTDAVSQTVNPDDSTGDLIVTWEITFGDLPEGFELDRSTGVISGSSDKYQEFTVTVTGTSQKMNEDGVDGVQYQTASFTVTVYYWPGQASSDGGTGGGGSGPSWSLVPGSGSDAGGDYVHPTYEIVYSGGSGGSVRTTYFLLVAAAAVAAAIFLAWAFFERRGYAVRYDDGTGIWRTDTRKSADSEDGVEFIVISDEPTRDGYEFAGWNDMADGSGRTYVEGQTIVLDKDNREITLYAQWRAV